MDKDLIDAIEGWRKAVRAMLETFADDTYLNGTSNGQFKQFDLADKAFQGRLADAKAKPVATPAVPPAAT